MLPHPLSGEWLKAWLLRWSADLLLPTATTPDQLLLHVTAAACRHFLKLNQVIERKP